MSEETLESYIRQLLEVHRTPEVTVAWQGGEPTLMKLEFFEHAVELVEKYRRPGQTVQQTFQTNGLLLDDAWCAFFKKHNFLVGLSVDGPREMHDANRRDRQGPGHLRPRDARLALSRDHGVEFNILCTVNAANQTHGRKVYRFFRDELGAKWMQFIPIVERATADTIAIANQGWSDHAAGQAPALHPDRRPRHRPLGRRRAVRPLPDRHFRGMGAARRRPRVRAAVRRDARGLFRPSSALHPCADLRLRSGAGAQWRSLHLRPFRRAGPQAGQHPRRRRCQSSSPRRRCASSATTSATR